MERLFEVNDVNYHIYLNHHSFIEGNHNSLYLATENLEKEEIYQLIVLNEVYQSALEYEEKNSSPSARLERDCAEAIAIAGTIITTVGAIAIGGSVGLGLFLIAKGYSTYQLIRACG